MPGKGRVLIDSIASKCRPKGITVPTTDMMIYSCAQVHQVELYHLDKHFDLLAAAGSQ